MTSAQMRLPLDRAPRLPDGAGAALLTIPVAAVLGAVAVLGTEEWRGLLAAAITINLIVVAMKWPRAAAVITLLFWLPFVGIVRRLLISETGWTQNDPLLLVGPIVALFLCYRLFVMEKRQIAPDRISKIVCFLLVLAVVGAFNPFGVGGVAGGLAGVIYLGVPLLWFLIGRELGNRKTMSFLIYGVVIVALGIGFYGLYQTEFGSFPQWDLDWFHITGYSALGVGQSEAGSLQFRPWSVFPSNSEYSAFLAIAAVFAIAMLYHRRPALAIAVPPLTIALFLAGGRSVMALMILSVMVVTALRTHNKVLALLVVILGIGAAYGAALTFGDRIDRAASNSGDPKAERQTGGLLNPLDPDESTFLGHWDNLVNGVEAGFTNPVGQGTGASNVGARAVSGGDGGEGFITDNDTGNVFVAWGFVGGIAFVILIFLSFKKVFTRYLRGRPDPLLLAVAGLMFVTFGQWLNGGHYATSAILFFMLGWAVRPRRRSRGEVVEEPLIPPGWTEAAPLRRLRGKPA